MEIFEFLKSPDYRALTLRSKMPFWETLAPVFISVSEAVSQSFYILLNWWVQRHFVLIGYVFNFHVLYIFNKRDNSLGYPFGLLVFFLFLCWSVIRVDAEVIAGWNYSVAWKVLVGVFKCGAISDWYITSLTLHTESNRYINIFLLTNTWRKKTNCTEQEDLNARSQQPCMGMRWALITR